MSEIKNIHVFPEFGTKEFNDLAFTYCGGKLKQEGKALTKEEVMEGRSSAYKFIDFDKQETLEEAAENYSGYEEHRMDFIAGAKWQAERMYSEEEIEKIISKLMDEVHRGDICFGDNIIDFKVSPRQWLEQFKKK